MTVIDYNPLNVTSLTVKSNNSVNDSYAKAGDEVEITLKTIGALVMLEDCRRNILDCHQMQWLIKSSVYKLYNLHLQSVLL